MMILGGIPAKEDHKAPGKSLAGDDSRRHGKTLAGAPAKPLPRTPVGPPSGPRQSILHHYSHAAADPTSWAGTCVAVCGSLWRPTTAPPQLPACLHGTAGAPGQGACRHERERRRTRQGSPPSPIKARTPGQDALNAPCHVMRGITSHHCTLSTSCVPLWQPLFL